jgi:drug/metabolite transporter (DMT)-like permease
LSKPEDQANCNVMEEGAARAATGAEPERLVNRVKGYLCVASAALFWGISASMGRAVFTGRLKILGRTVGYLPPIMLAQGRVTFSFLILLAILLLVRGWRGVALRPGEILKCMLLGIFGIAESNFFYYFAISKTTVATAIIVQYMAAPVFVLLYMLARGRQRATASRILGVVLAVTGSELAIGLVVAKAGFPWLGLEMQRLKFQLLGVLSAVIAAVGFAFWNIYGSSLVETRDRWRVMVWAMFGAGLGWMLIHPPQKIIAAHYEPQQWLFLLIFAVSSSLVPFSLYLWGLVHLDPTRAIVTSCLEPVFAVICAALTLGETVNAFQIAGIAVVLTATILVQIPERAKLRS